MDIVGLRLERGNYRIGYNMKTQDFSSSFSMYHCHLYVSIGRLYSELFYAPYIVQPICHSAITNIL